MNVVHLIGYLGRDPEERGFQNGDRVASFPLATHKRLPAGSDGERRERTDWHKIRVYGPADGGMVEVVLRYARKGTRLRLTGELTSSSMIDAQGNRIPITFIDVRPGGGDIELMDPPRRTAGTPAPERPAGRAAADPLETRDGLLGDDLA